MHAFPVISNTEHQKKMEENVDVVRESDVESNVL